MSRDSLAHRRQAARRTARTMGNRPAKPTWENRSAPNEASTQTFSQLVPYTMALCFGKGHHQDALGHTWNTPAREEKRSGHARLVGLDPV